MSGGCPRSRQKFSTSASEEVADKPSVDVRLFTEADLRPDRPSAANAKGAANSKPRSDIATRIDNGSPIAVR